MKITLEVNDFYLDEQDIESGLKEFIINDVIQKVHKSIESKIDDTITRVVKDQVTKSLYRDIQKIVAKVVSEGKIQTKDGYNSNKIPMTIEEYVKHDFEHNTGYSSPKDKITELAKNFGNELKRRYDLLFASQIVAKLNENGLLKEDAVKMLLETISK
jgi:hypothetical protein